MDAYRLHLPDRAFDSVVAGEFSFDEPIADAHDLALALALDAEGDLVVIWDASPADRGDFGA